MLVRYDQKLDIRRQFTPDLKRGGRRPRGDPEAPDRRPQVRAEPRHTPSAASRYSRLGDGGYGATAEGALAAWAGEESIMVQGALDAPGLGGELAGRRARPQGDPLRQRRAAAGAGARPVHDLHPRSRSLLRPPTGLSEMTAQKFDLTTRFRQMTSHASRNRVAFYPIEAYGTRAERGTQLFDSVALVEPPERAPLPGRGHGRPGAAQRHGRARRARPDGRGLRDLLLDRLPAAAAGRRGGAQDRGAGEAARARRCATASGTATSRWGRRSPRRTLAVMRFGPEDNPLGVALEIVPGKKAGEMLVRVKVPVAKLYLQPQEGSREGRLRLYVVASGEGCDDAGPADQAGDGGACRRPRPRPARRRTTPTRSRSP